VPFLVQWKGKLPSGKTYDLPVINTDILPTVLAAGGTSIDPGWKLDGVNLLPYLTGANTARPHETLYWRYGPQWAIRHGDLKLVVSRGGSGQPELFDLSQDLGERNNLAAAQPEKVKQLQAMWDAWSAEQAPPSAPDASPNKKKDKAKARADRKAKRAAKGA
jgi:arylsulfatase A-like enzyme